tara:strand:+ start:185 stop:499 length:315 start_codon:yes stop_codon:yes gene_type:complete
MPRELRLTNTEINNILDTLDFLFNKMTIDEKKAILNKIGISKRDIEALDADNYTTRLKTEYTTVLRNFDKNNPQIDAKYKTGCEYMSKKKKTELKTEIKNYKKK